MRGWTAGARGALLCSLLLLATREQAMAQSAQPLPDGLTLTDTTLAPQTWVHGMVERRFVIENPTTQTLPVQITLPASTYSGDGLAGLSQTVLANAGTRTLATLHQPPVRQAGRNSILVKVGRHSPQQIGCQPVNAIDKNYYSSTLLSLLVSKGLSAEKLKARLEATAPGTASGRSHTSASELSHLSLNQVVARMFTHEAMKELKPLRFEGGGEAWPRHWLAYSAFDGCLIAAADYEQMSEESRRALRDYAAIGGHVTFMDMPTLPEGWETGVRPGLRRDGIGFGHAGTLPATDFTTIASNDMARLAAGWIETARPWLAASGTTAELLKAIPVAGNVRVPARTFLAILLVFALLAGPGAVLYTRRANRRLWLLAIVPGFSLLFSLAIVAYALLSEGITPAQHRQAVTLLDQARRQAATVGALGVYAPVSLRDGLQFDLGTEITPLSAVRSGRIATGHGQHYVSGWVKPRLPAFFTLRRSETRAERLVVTGSATGVVEVVNALGAPILRLQLCDARGNLYETRGLAPGERRTLVSARTRPPGALAVACRIRLPGQRAADSGWRFEELAGRLLDEKQNTFEPAVDSYVAVLDGAPLLDDPLAYCRTRASARSIVVGWPCAE